MITPSTNRVPDSRSREEATRRGHALLKILEEELERAGLSAERRSEVASAMRVAMRTQHQGKRAPDTERRYLAEYRRMRSQRLTPREPLTCKRTFYFRRAAWVFGVLDEIESVMRDFIVAARHGEAAARQKAAGELVNLAQDIAAFPPDRERRHIVEARNDERVGDFAQLTEGDEAVSSRDSKRMGLELLPDNWLEQLIEHAERAGSPHVLPIAVLVATGCRPVELRYGAEVTLGPGRREVAIRIRGAKIKEGVSGQLERVLTVDRNDPGVHRLYRAALGAGEAPLMIQVKSKHGLEQAIAKFGERVYSEPGHKISSYSLRHQFASDLKSMNFDVETIAAAMGHAVDRTAQGYGLARYGRSRRRLRVNATAPIKRTASDPRALSNKSSARQVRPAA